MLMAIEGGEYISTVQQTKVRRTMLYTKEVLHANLDCVLFLE